MILDEGLGNHKAYDEGHNRKKENPECRNHPAFRVYLYLYYITDVDPFRAMVPNPTHKRNRRPGTLVLDRFQDGWEENLLFNLLPPVE